MNVDFAQVRDRLERRKKELVLRTQRVERDLGRVAGPLSADFSEAAVEAQNDAALTAIGEAAREEIDAISVALERLATGEYGLCTQCGDPIAVRRLTAVPHATVCARCGA